MKTAYKVITVLLILVSMTAIGCTDVAGDEPVNEAPGVEAVEDNQTMDVAEDFDDPEELDTGEPELKIMSVTGTQNGMEITVKNVGNATAESVYCGILPFGYSNSITFSEYMTYEEMHEIMLPAVIEGVSGDAHVYETNYSYKDTPNLIIKYRLESIDYIGNIPEGEAMAGEMNAYEEPYDEEYWKIAWIEGDEENYVVY
ncbi:hypothetical protein [Methanococcoides sp. AM1]|uniref:hypothetical protein n=1 Tax=Methanococcoides sp. AM1 TaxID=1201011 RepID=UPI00108492BA|nr:hypothetical protein [Methanococcoides sp. AM1]